MVQINLIHPGQCTRQVTTSKKVGSSCKSIPGKRQHGYDNTCYGLKWNFPHRFVHLNAWYWEVVLFWEVTNHYRGRPGWWKRSWTMSLWTVNCPCPLLKPPCFLSFCTHCVNSLKFPHLGRGPRHYASSPWTKRNLFFLLSCFLPARY